MKKTFYRTLTILLIFFVAACASKRSNWPERTKSQPVPVQTRSAEIIKAPWEVWSVDTLGDVDLARAESEVLNNSFEQACSFYSQALRVSSNPNVRDQARLRLVGTLLKIGKSNEALQEITRYTQEVGITPQQLRPDYALLAAWAYVHQSQPDQSFAWFRVANQVVDDGSAVAAGSRKGIRSLLKSLTPTQFESVSQKWNSDGIISKYLKEERLRRIQEGEGKSYSLAKFFSANYYHGSQVIEQQVVVDNNQATTDIGSISIGVLLPLTGKFAEHAIKVKEGIELAAQQVELKFGDTQGDPAIAVMEYERLVNQEKVDVVLGPMLVATSEAVGERSVSLGVPIVSFTKREGLPGIGSTVFRLGATASNQVNELLNYTSEKLSISNYAVVYPSNENSADFVAEFEKAVGLKGGKVVARQMYSPGDTESIRIAVESVAAAQAQAIFLPDNLENCFSVLEQIKSQGLANITILGSALWSDQVAIRGYGQLLEGAVFVSLFNSHSSDTNIVNFISTFRQRHRHDPDLLAAQSYDATNFVVQALQSGTGNVEKRLVSSQPYLGVTGELNVQADGEIVRRISVMNVVKGDALEVQFAGQARGVMPTAGQ